MPPDPLPEPTIDDVIGGIIRDARLAAEVTQEALAEAIGKSRTTVVNMEGGVQNVILRALYDIAFALSVSVKDLLPDEPKNGSLLTELALAMLARDAQRGRIPPRKRRDRA